MIINNIKALCNIAVILLCVGVTSCSQDDLGIGKGEPLPPGKYPLMVTAAVDGMANRSSGKDFWGDGDEIAVRIGSDGPLGRYMLNSDGSVKKLVKSVAWQSTGHSTVKAWFPYSQEAKTVTINDQSNGFYDYDFLTAIAEDQSYLDRVALRFKHQMAKVSCNFIKDDGISDEEWSTFNLEIAGYNEATFSEGALSGDIHGWITPTSDYQALLIPQDMTNREFIKISITVNVNGVKMDKTFVYKPADGNLLAGTHYTYTITVKKDRIIVTTVSAAWNDEGLPHEAEPAPFKINLRNLTDQALQELSFSPNVTLHFGDNSIAGEDKNYLIVKGNRFTISFKINRSNVIKGLLISVGGEQNTVHREIADGYYVFNFYVREEEITLSYTDYVETGDYYYEDGTWASPQLDMNKTPIGIVFRNSPGGVNEFADEAKNYEGKLSTIHGYVVALQNASDAPVKWGASGDIPGNTIVLKPFVNAPYTGYNPTKNIEKWGQSHDYTATLTALNYETITKSPDDSSGWYLPSIAQLEDIENMPNRAQLFTDPIGKDLLDVPTGVKPRYWSCSSNNINSKAWTFTFGVGGGAQTLTRNSGMASNHANVRAVLTF